jgi:hypothetical protein
MTNSPTPDPGDVITEEMIRHDNGDLYCGLMVALKYRLDFVACNYQLKAQGKIVAPSSPLIFESSLLQLRFCCELLALGCIAMHTDVPATNKLRKEYNAEKIIKVFGHLKPEFFPRAVDPNQIVIGTLAGQALLPGALTKQEFLKAYSHFGDVLHAGVFEDYKAKKQKNYDWREIEDFRVKLMMLLRFHVFEMHEGRKAVRIDMHDQNGNVTMRQTIVCAPTLQPTESSSSG